jgi:hypothetical protein
LVSLRLSSFNLEIKESDLTLKSTTSTFCDAEGGSGKEEYIPLVNLELPKYRMLYSSESKI